jgi:LysR family transcriptional regulator, nod-box dependent transcriptional activator
LIVRFKNLDLNLLAALDKLIHLRSVSRAAEELSITQSAMSNALNRLRHHFDDPLLVQVGRRMELTPRAIALEQPVRDILVRIDAAVATPPGFDPETSSRRIGLMVSDYSLHTIVPPFLAAIASKAPSMRFDIKPQQILPQLQLERGDTDLLIAPGLYSSPDHPSERLLLDPMVCVMDADNPAVRDGLSMEAFLEAQHVVMVPPNTGESFAARVMREAGLSVQIAVTSFSFASLPDLVRSTRRIALVQERLARRMARLGGLAVLPPPLTLPALEQRVQWHTIRGKDPALEWLRTELHASLATETE